MLMKTDSEIEQWVLRELSLSEKLFSREVCVLASAGVVRLRGSAASYEDRLAVEEAARRAAGVVGVVNEIRIKPSIALIERVLSGAPLTESPLPCVLIQPVATPGSKSRSSLLAAHES